MKLFEPLPHRYRYNFHEGEPCQTIAEFLDRVKKVEEADLYDQLIGRGFERWEALQQSERDDFSRLRGDLEKLGEGRTITAQALRKEILKILSSPCRRLEALGNALSGKPSGPIASSMIIATASIGACWFDSLWIGLGAALAFYITLVNYVVVPVVDTFKVTRPLPKSMYDALKFCFYVLVLAIGTIMGLTVGRYAEIGRMEGVLFPVSLFAVVLGIIHVVNLPREESATEVRVSNVHWFLASFMFLIAIISFACAFGVLVN